MGRLHAIVFHRSADTSGAYESFGSHMCGSWVFAALAVGQGADKPRESGTSFSIRPLGLNLPGRVLALESATRIDAQD
jgi:hypothetical protein